MALTLRQLYDKAANEFMNIAYCAASASRRATTHSEQDLWLAKQHLYENLAKRANHRAGNCPVKHGHKWLDNHCRDNMGECRIHSNNEVCMSHHVARHAGWY